MKSFQRLQHLLPYQLWQFPFYFPLSLYNPYIWSRPGGPPPPPPPMVSPPCPLGLASKLSPKPPPPPLWMWRSASSIPMHVSTPLYSHACVNRDNPPPPPPLWMWRSASSIHVHVSIPLYLVQWFSCCRLIKHGTCFVSDPPRVIIVISKQAVLNASLVQVCNLNRTPYRPS